MASSGSERERQEDRWAGPRAGRAADLSDRALLHDVLQKTLTVCSSDEPLDGENRRALDAVVDRHRGKPFGVEPVAVELVEAVLRTEKAKPPGSRKPWRAVARQVAQTLCGDPSARQRLEAFWVRLGGEG
jgi:hypothetical protein